MSAPIFHSTYFKPSHSFSLSPIFFYYSTETKSKKTKETVMHKLNGEKYTTIINKNLNNI
jgi:hypothetical protein